MLPLDDTSAGGLSVALSERDTLTQEHCGRVSELCHAVGMAVALSSRELKLLRLASGLHDVGKIGIPDEVLKKQTRFTESDWAIMRTHSARGERILLASGVDDADVVAAAVRHHHERCDGQGYPDGLAGEAIPILSRIVAIADAYDAMARMRNYGTPRRHRDIVAELRNQEGQQHDAYFLGKFAEVIEASPYRAPD